MIVQGKKRYKLIRNYEMKPLIKSSHHLHYIIPTLLCLEFDQIWLEKSVQEFNFLFILSFSL